MPDTTRQHTAAEAIRAHAILALGFSLAVNILFFASPLYMMQLYGRVLDSRSLETLASLSAMLLLVLIAMAAADAARGRLLARAAARLERHLGGAPQPAGQSEAGRLRDLGMLRGMLADTAATTLCDAPFTLFFLFALFLIHPLLGLVATAGAAVILGAVLVARWSGRRREASIAASEAGARALAETLDRDRGELEAIGALPNLQQRLAAALAEESALRREAGEAAAGLGAFNRMVRMLAHGAALATGAILTLEGLMAPAAMLASAILAGRALGPIEALPGALRQAGAARAALCRLEEAGPAPAHAAPARTGAGAAVSLSRAMVLPKGAARPALRGIALEIAAGETIAVLGPAGSGKSALARVLAGCLPLAGGQLRVAGVDPASLDPVDRARLIGWMGQEPALYPGTVAENIASFAEAPFAEVAAAAEAAGIRALIEDLPGGFAARTGAAGGEVPPGLRQRIALARALFGRPQLVILDQPTSLADAEGEVAALNALRALKEAGTTVIVISHKPVLASFADRILMMKDGMIEHFEPRDRIIGTMRRRTIGAVGTGGEMARGAAQ
ncbi:ATP-binding cassette domain-containing protein [Poseidonocella sp. HB161398]|uniref:ATP-binding cassette domain-containing protein n=1 Tax=Poseidonocella sp. HB161398 TaxID=2320855 RepID=UPI0014874A60|nr:ATP-binding cassette domain-containing protein [Poseidonocella sp. HB161398]